MVKNGSGSDFPAESSIQKLASVFPECITEYTDENGVIQNRVDFEMLRSMLTGDMESYEFSWVGKRASAAKAAEMTDKKMVPCPDESIDWEHTENLYIEGDNIDALRLLRNNYSKKIKIIYIDPPYNTGHDFVYPDSFVMNKSEYREKTNVKDQKISDDGRYHSEWCSMMFSRLLIARDLLNDDGVIFISIDDNEVTNLRKICDEVFGSEQFITCFIWEKTQHFGRQKVNYYSNCEYILCYAKKLYNENGIKELLVEYVKKDFLDAPLYNASNTLNTITFPAGSTEFRISDGLYSHSTDDKFQLLDKVKVKNGRNVNDFRLKFRSRWSAEKVMDEYGKGTTFLVKSKRFSIRTVYHEGKKFNESPKQLISTNPNNPFSSRNCFGVKVGTSETGSSDLEKLGLCGFSYPKPVSLIEYLISLVKDNECFVLDFFSGSATTAQAVMRLNSLDSGKRKFIMVQLPEPLDTDNKAINDGYRTICDIGKERIRRTGKLLDINDSGFRVYKLK